MKRIYPKEEVCIGCRLCEIWCIVQHSKSKDVVKAYKDERPRQLTKVYVEERIPVSFAIQCRHCSDAPCIEGCLTGAMYRNDSGIVLVDENKCIGCNTCIMVCPFGVIRRKLDKKVVSKCDLCIGEDTPACVANCPNEALVYEER